MIKSIVPGDITKMNTTDSSDILVGMNSALRELHDITLPNRWRSQHNDPFPLGSVVSFKLSSKQNLHALICHELGVGGWNQADRYVRIGMDHLWSRFGNSRYFSTVEIGKGSIGVRDGADHAAIRAAIEASWLSVDLFIFDSPQPVAIQRITPKQLQALSYWNPITGLENYKS